MHERTVVQSCRKGVRTNRSRLFVACTTNSLLPLLIYFCYFSFYFYFQIGLPAGSVEMYCLIKRSQDGRQLSTTRQDQCKLDRKDNIRSGSGHQAVRCPKCQPQQDKINKDMRQGSTSRRAAARGSQLPTACSINYSSENFHILRYIQNKSGPCCWHGPQFDSC